ncbi:hypothetical protein L2E82_48111 [Cichorium intybus]|uniref:Uncharacterized protein n=1 Tax=Cichorium intybus TaxID=13427 RepID=A0ACB8YY41_CICIN|nr:hypothetical protein L2E82_48111 [Cichorium intybus]
MPRTTTVESAVSPLLRALTFDVLGSDSMHPSDSLIHTLSQSPVVQKERKSWQINVYTHEIFDFSKKWVFRLLKSLAVQDLQVKKTILDCLSSKTLVLPESGEDDHNRKRYFDYLEYSRFGFINSQRTCRLAEADSPAPSPSSSPTESPIIQRPPSPPFFLVVPLDPTSCKAGQAPLDSSEYFHLNMVQPWASSL